MRSDSGDKKSAIKDHAESTTIIEKRVHNTHKRLFLESLHSVLDKRSTNEHNAVMQTMQSCNDHDTNHYFMFCQRERDGIH